MDGMGDVRCEMGEIICDSEVLRVAGFFLGVRVEVADMGWRTGVGSGKRRGGVVM